MKRIHLLFGVLAVCIAVYCFGFFYTSKYNNYKESYINTLYFIHQTVKPDVYLEIGVDTGKSINLALPQTHTIGVDPVKLSGLKLKNNIVFYQMESDKFFADKTIMSKEFSQKKANITFIDGMHLYEYVLRDFINAEKVSYPNSIILLHDTLPIAEDVSKRKQNWNGEMWTGDVYKIVPILKKYRPDLDIKIIDSDPSGLCVVSHLDPNSKILEDNYDKIIKEFKDYSYEEIEKFEEQNIKLVKPTEKNVKKLLKKAKIIE